MWTHGRAGRDGPCPPTVRSRGPRWWAPPPWPWWPSAFGTAAAAAGAAPRSAEAARNERVQVLNAWKSGGDSTKEAAAKALIGTDAQIHTFLTSELGPLAEEDGRVAVLKMLGNACLESVERRSRRCPERPTISACFLPMAGKRPIRTISASKYCG